MAERPADVMRRSKRQNIDSVIQFPENLGAHAMMLSFKKYKYIPPGDPQRGLLKITDSTYTPQELAGTDTILLPLPSNIRDSYNIRIQGYEAGLMGAGLGTVASNLAGVGNLSFEDLVSAGSNTMRQLGIPTTRAELGENISGTVTRGVAAYAARKGLDTIVPNAGRSIDAGLGNVINPKASLFFDGMNLKQFDFQWTLAPMKETESDVIRQINNTVKRNILPSYSTVLGFKRSLLNYPSTVDIYFFGIDQEYFLHYKTAMVQSFNLEFAQQGQAILKGGKPAVQTMTMTLMETDIHTSEDYGGESTESLDVTLLMQDPNGPGRGR